MPDPDRWPSSCNGSGFTEVAQQVHAMGLKFGIHVMRGISTAAVNANSPILGAKVLMTWTLVSHSGFEFSDMMQCIPYSPWMWEFSDLWPVVMTHACMTLNLSAVEPRILLFEYSAQEGR